MPAPSHLKDALKAEEVRRLMIAKAEGSALTAADAKRLRFTARTAGEAAARKYAAHFACFEIPYFDINGKPTDFYRVRYLQDTRKGFDAVTGKKSLRYTQPANTTTELYMPPLVDWAAIAPDVNIPLLITEGELKAACATKHGLPTLGLGGVWSFQSTKHAVELLPIFKKFDFTDRTVYIVFDSDAVTNPNVVAAENRLAKRLTERGAHVHIGRLKQTEDGQKMGLDDYILLYSAAELKAAVLDTAFEFEPSAKLHELNEAVLYVEDPGFIWDHRKAIRISPGAFKEHAYANHHYWERRMRGKEESLVKVPAAPAWLAWEHRATAKGLVFSPGDEPITQEGYLNTWTGWGVNNPVPGDIAPWHDLMKHLFGADTEARLWFERWCAAPLQTPGLKMAVAAALWGPVHGSGKTLVGHTLMRIYGKHSAELKDSDLEDERNSWAEGNQFVLADDITARGDRAFMRRLMTMITQKWVTLNPKFIPSYRIQDVMNYYFTSNDPDALYMDDGDRRFFIWEIQAGKYTPYKRYVEWRDSDEGISALWAYFLGLPLGDFDPQAPAPTTQAKSSMIHLGKSDLGSWVRELRDNAPLILKRAGYKGDLFNAKELHALYDPTGEKRTTVNALARELKRAGFNPPATGNSLHMPDGSNTMAYAILNGADWRVASWSDACKHYISNRPAATWDFKPRGKL